MADTSWMARVGARLVTNGYAILPIAPGTKKPGQFARAAWHDYPSLLHGLQFFLDWPALDRAAELMVVRHDEIDGDYYEYLAPAAEALSERHPLAATLVLRAMIDFTLTRSRAKRYRYAAEHLLACARLARDIPDFGAFEAHDAYVARLKEEHGRKFGFWSLTKA